MRVGSFERMRFTRSKYEEKTETFNCDNYEYANNERQ